MLAKGGRRGRGEGAGGGGRWTGAGGAPELESLLGRFIAYERAFGKKKKK